MTRARQVANFDPALFAADEVSGDKVSSGTIGGDTIINTSGAITTTGAFTSVGIDDNASGAVAIYIDSDEKVAIGGHTSPTYALDVEASVAGGYLLELNNTHTASGGGLLINSANGSPGNQELLRINNQGNTKFEVHADGGVGINTSSPSGYLHVNGAGGWAVIFQNHSSGGVNYQIEFKNSAGTQRGYISTSESSNSTTYSTSSDYRLKENIEPLDDALKRLNQLKPKRFNWIEDSSKTIFDGFLAHEVSNIVAEAIGGKKDAVDDNGDPVYQGIDQSKLVPLLVAAVQELSAKNDALEARVTALESA